MVDSALQRQLAEINAKLDGIAAELAVTRRQRAELEDLKNDLTIVAKDVLDSAIVELEDVAPFVKTGDFLHLLKKILRNTNTITGAIEQLESALDFYHDARPIGKSLFNDVLDHLDELDRQGYFAFFRELTAVAKNIVAHFSPDDVRLLSENIVTIMETVKNLTQPEMLKALNNASTVFRNLDPDAVEEYSAWKLLREVNSPEIKRGLGFLITFLKNVSNPSTNTDN
ncbi:MAG: DUF1641 domain-containing protein [Candidatus Neomarinimicrobiota bacterium]